MSVIGRAKKVLEIEADQIKKLSSKLDDTFIKAIDMIISCKGKVVCTGIGKSGHIASKIVSTFNSTGTPSLFIHPSEGSHGDLGVITENDIVLAISYSGESTELLDILKFVKRRDIKLISMTATKNSSLYKASDIVLDVAVDHEACPIGLAPTASSTVCLAMGDAIAMVLLEKRGFKEKDFAEIHPGGSLGKRLLTRVKDVMYNNEKGLISVPPDENIKSIALQMTSQEISGIVCVVDQSNSLVGVITDGDLRRSINKDLFEKQAHMLMNKNPLTIDQDKLAEHAMYIMQQNEIQALVVINNKSSNPKKPVGILHLQTLLSYGIR